MPGSPSADANAELRFARIQKMIGTAGLDRLRRSKVVVVGLGAVGSYAVEGLARAGVGFMRLIDFDILRPTNLNRQLYALESTLGKSKVEVARQRVLDINPHCTVEARSCFAHQETLPDLLQGTADVVIDAIDSLAPKVELIAAARQQGLTVLSSMGAAQRWDLTQIAVAQLAQAHGCPLARLVRKKLRSRGVPLDFLCVYSSEPVARKRASTGELPEEAEYFPRGRPRQPLGSLPTVTGIFGLTLAHVAIQVLLSAPPAPSTMGPGQCQPA
jgi:tRNA threonylcarbamoyladenosine dehydratase